MEATDIAQGLVDADVRALLPCPFCCGEAEFEYTPWNEETETGDDGTGWIECQVCHVQMNGFDRDDAEQRWNKRHNT